MTAKEKLRQQLAETPDQDLEKLEALMEDALPAAFRASRTMRLTETARPLGTRLGWAIDDLTEDEAQQILEYLDWAAAEADTASDEEVAEAATGQAEIARGKYATLEQLQRKLSS